MEITGEEDLTGDWLDDIKEWCQKDMHLLIRIALERKKWRQVVKCSLDTYGLGYLPMDHDDDDDEILRKKVKYLFLLLFLH